MRKTITTLILIAINYLSFGTVINVPTDYAMIGDALAHAVQSDTVMVSPGTYHENISWPQVNSIKLISTNGPDSTIIAGIAGSVIRIYPLIVFSFDNTTVIDGFQIINGNMNTTYAEGGGLYLSNASVTLNNLDIHDNSVSSPDWANGAGIDCEYDSDPIISGCRIHNNHCTSTSWAYGGGMYFFSDCHPHITNSTIYDNTCTGNWAGGAGVYGDFNSVLYIDNCKISNNTSTDPTGQGYTFGAGLDVERSTAYLNNDTISGNYLSGGDWKSGAGLYCSECIINAQNVSIDFNTSLFAGTYFNGGGVCAEMNSTLNFNNSSISNNGISDTSWIYEGAGVFAYSGTHLNFMNTIITDNYFPMFDPVETHSGGGIFCEDNCTIDLINCTISNNGDIADSNVTGGGLCLESTSGSIKNTIIWNPKSAQEIFTSGQTPIVTYCDIRNGYNGPGNISTDPLFISSNDYHLTPSSGCVNSGTSAGAPGNDCEGNIRPLPAGSFPDIGAYEIDQMQIRVTPVESHSHQISIMPNPVESVSTLTIEGNAVSSFFIKIFDESGREIFNKDISFNEMKINRSAFHSGIYFYHVKTNTGNAINGKFLVE